MNNVFQKLVSHLGWANDAVITSLRQTPTPGADWLEVMAHILGAEHVWLSRIDGSQARFAVWPTLTVDDCAALARQNMEAIRTLVSSTPDPDFQRMVHYRNSAGREFDSTVEDILLHVCLHGAYHRGQVARAMRQGGAVPAPTDYIGYIRGAPAATRQRDS